MSSSPAAEYLVTPHAGPVRGIVRVPGSKSLTNRVLPLAAMANRPFTVHQPLASEDTAVMIDALKHLGFTVEQATPQGPWTISRPPGPRVIPASQADCFVGNSGTTVRFLGAMVGLGTGSYRFDGVPRMRERPIQDLLDGLNQLGIQARSESGTGCPPILIQSQGWHGGTVRLRAELSSQFLSGMLLAAPFGTGTTSIELVGPVVSEPYIDMTVRLLRQFGLTIQTAPGTFVIPGQQSISRRDYTIEPDASSASYFFAIAAILGGDVTLAGLHLDSLQGDVHFAEALVAMGCTLEATPQGLKLSSSGQLRGVELDMNAISDTVMTLAVVACFAQGATRIYNVAHIRHKETDRLSAIATELRRVGARVSESSDGLVIEPSALHGASCETYNDHRMAMSLALLGLKVPGIQIMNPGCTAKTYPGFWQDLEAFLQNAR